MNSLSASSVDIVEIPEELVGVDRELAPGGGIKWEDSEHAANGKATVINMAIAKKLEGLMAIWTRPDLLFEKLAKNGELFEKFNLFNYFFCRYLMGGIFTNALPHDIASDVYKKYWSGRKTIAE